MGEWMLLHYADVTTARVHEARKMLNSIALRDGTTRALLRRVRLMLDGASALGFYSESDITQPSWLYDEVCFLLGRTEKEIAAEFEDGLDRALGIPRDRRRIAVIHDFLQTDGRLIAKVTAAGRRSFTSRILNPVRSSVRRLVRA